MPLYILCGEQVLCARLRTADQDGAEGTVEELERSVSRVRARWPGVRILLRGDSGFCRDQMMDWCEAHQVDSLLGVANNARLKASSADELKEAKAVYEKTGEAARVCGDVRDRTLKSWSRERRVVDTAEHLPKGDTPRCVVTTLSPAECDARTLYEQMECARGDMDNRIKEQQLSLFVDRTSTHSLHANQVRVYLSSFASAVMQHLRRMGLEGTELARAHCDTIRLKLLKIGTQIRVSVRRVWVSFSGSDPYAALFQRILGRLETLPIRS